MGPIYFCQASMNLLMISGDRSVLQGKKGAFWYTLEELRKYFERIDIICPKIPITKSQSPSNSQFSISNSPNPFPNVFFHPSPHGLWYQPRWIAKKGRELIAKHRHAVMSVHEYPPFYNGLGAEWLSRRTGVPYVLEVHHIVGYPHASSSPELLGRILSHLFLPHDVHGARAVRCVSRGTVDVLERWGAPQEKLFVVPSFYLDHEALKPDPLIAKHYDVVCCGRLVANKGFGNVVRAIARMPGVKLLIIGDGPERGSLEQLAKRLGAADRVTIAGWLPESADVYRAMQSAKVFVMNSGSEGGPRAVLEAMALGLPVVATAVGVMPDILSEGATRNGYLTSGTPEDLAEKIGKLLEYPSLCERLGREARKTVEKFEKGRLVREYAQFLQSQGYDGNAL